jgi:hypothetical protein
MFQVGDIVQVIIVPKKYKQYDIAGATGVVKEMEILCSYRVVEYPFGRMTVGGSTCGK